MKISLNWLKEFIDFKASSESLHHLFTMHSQEVESINPLVDAQGLLVGYVKTCSPHPNANQLSVCQVDIKKEILTIVCGAPNVKAGQKVIVALAGTTLPNNLVINKSVIRGTESNGMICSLSELGIEHKYHHEDGIHVIAEDAEIGADALEVLGFNDTVMTLDLTPNRADLLSIHGVAYDLAAMTNTTVKINEPKVLEGNAVNTMKISTQTSSCKSYYGRVIENLTIKPSPAWMKARLIAAGIRPINNIVDITNYVMLETGQPLHAFDYQKLNSDTIVVRDAIEGERFTTLDDKERLLKQGDILITDGKRPIALGGVMGGAETEVRATTTAILLESATFEYKAVRATSHRLDLRSESSLRFERRVDPGKTLFALNRATELFHQYAQGISQKGVQYFDDHPSLEKTIPLTQDKINRVLGIQLDTKTIGTLLDRLGLTHEVENKTLHIKIPSRRQDLETYQDLIEEIGRLHGYDKLPSTLPTTVSLGFLTPLQKFRRRLRNALTGLGLNEVIGYTLTDQETVGDFTQEAYDDIVTVVHPMSERRKTMMLSPINHLLEMLVYNQARQQYDVALFELAKSYRQSGEKEVLAIAITGNYRSHLWQTTPPTNFYTLKAILEALSQQFNMVLSYKPITLKHYHPHQTARIYSNGQCVGHIGKIHPQKALEMDLKEVYVLEIDILPMSKWALEEEPYRIIERYPSIERDIAIICETDILAGDIIDAITRVGGKTLKSVDVFDVYHDVSIGASKKSLGLRMLFIDSDKTLKAETVDALVQKIVGILEKEFQAQLR